MPYPTNDFNRDGLSDIGWITDGNDVFWLNKLGGYFDTHASTYKALTTVVGDFNGDGYADAFHRGYGGSIQMNSRLYVGSADGLRLDSPHQFAISGVDISWTIEVSGDFNGDGRDDLIWRHTSGELSTWLSTTSRFDGQDYTTFSIHKSPTVDLSWEIVAAGDFNGDGRDDMIWRHTSGEITEWLGQADGTFIDNYDVAKAVVDNSWRIVAAGDFNGDGREDLIWRHSTGEITQWLGQADGSFFDNYNKAGLKIPTDWNIISTGDYNGDSRTDLLWQHSGGSLTQYLFQADGSFVQAANFAIASPEWHAVSSDIFSS